MTLNPCYTPVISLCSVGIILNTVQVILQLRTRRWRPSKIIFVSFAISDIVLGIIVITALAIPMVLSSIANRYVIINLSQFGIYCSMLNIILIAIEEGRAVFSNKEGDEGSRKTVISVLLMWTGCFALAVTVGITDIYQDMDIVILKINPVVFMLTSIMLLLAYVRMCYKVHYRNQQLIKQRNIRSLGRGMIIDMKLRIQMMKKQNNLGMSFGLFVTFFICSYPVMLTLYLVSDDLDIQETLEAMNETKCQKTIMHQILLIFFCTKTVIDPILCICVKHLIPRCQKKKKMYRVKKPA